MNNDLIDVKKLRPFTRFCMTIGELPSSYLISMTYEEQLIWFCNYLEKTVIPTVNNNGEAVTELQNLYAELKNYVDHYFDNLDIQEEVNNKLDKMVEDGTFDTIINQELFGELDSQINDSNYYNLNYKTGRAYDTTYYIVTVPLRDEDNNLINVYTDIENVTPLQYAEEHKTTLTVNAGLTRQNASEVWEQGIVIKDGVIINPAPVDIEYPDYYNYIGFTENREILEYQANMTTATQMINDGVKNAYLVFYRYMNNGLIDETHASAPNWTVESPRLDIGLKNDGTLVFLACDGRTENNKGLLNTEALTIMQNEGCIKAWRCDGGGSTSLNLKGSKINRNIDDDGTTDRKITCTLNIKKEIVNNERADIYNQIGNLRQLLNKQIRDDMLTRMQEYEHKKGKIYYQVNNNSLNNITTDTAGTYLTLNFTGKYRHGNSITTLYDNSNHLVGFNLNKDCLYRIVIVAMIETQKHGDRTIKITTGANDDLDWLQLKTCGTEGSTEYHQIICDTVINNNTGTTKTVKIWKKGLNLDRWLRCTAYCEEIGEAESNPS